MPKPTPPGKSNAPRSPRHAELRAYLADLCARLLASSAPPDKFIGGYFRLRPNIVGGARGFLAATVYALLRQRCRTLCLWRWAGRDAPRFPWPEPGTPPSAEVPPDLEAALALLRWLREDLGEEPADALELAREALAIAQALPPLKGAETFEPVVRVAGAELEEFARALESDPGLANAPEQERLASRLSLPWDLTERWKARFGLEALEKLGEAFRQTAPLDLRVNTMLASRRGAAEALAEEDVETFPTPYSPDGLRLARKTSLKRTRAWRQGLIETQDEGSQIVALALAPQPGWRVLDACAGGGGKTLHLANLMEGKGEVVARDIDAGRLEAIGKRSGRSRSGSMVSCWGPGEPTPAACFDAVLIDAPCLGLGTLRRNPHFALFGPLRGRLAEIHRAQRDILEQYCPLARPGAPIVYAACSFEPEETTELIDAFLADHPEYEPDPLSGPFAGPGLKKLLDGDPTTWRLALLPHERQTDGFFICRFRRKPACPKT